MQVASKMRPKLELLRAQLSTKPRLTYPCSQLQNGIPRGALTEISGPHGSGKTKLVLNFLAQNPKLRVAWIEDELSIYPCVFSQYDISLEHVLFVEAGSQAPWAAHQVLRSKLFEVIVLMSSSRFHEIELRRLQLLAEQALATVLLIAEEKTRRGTWPLALQISEGSRYA